MILCGYGAEPAGNAIVQLFVCGDGPFRKDDEFSPLCRQRGGLFGVPGGYSFLLFKVRVIVGAVDVLIQHSQSYLNPVFIGRGAYSYSSPKQYGNNYNPADGYCAQLLAFLFPVMPAKRNYRWNKGHHKSNA